MIIYALQVHRQSFVSVHEEFLGWRPIFLFRPTNSITEWRKHSSALRRKKKNFKSWENAEKILIKIFRNFTFTTFMMWDVFELKACGRHNSSSFQLPSNFFSACSKNKCLKYQQNRLHLFIIRKVYSYCESRRQQRLTIHSAAKQCFVVLHKRFALLLVSVTTNNISHRLRSCFASSFVQINEFFFFPCQMCARRI